MIKLVLCFIILQVLLILYDVEFLVCSVVTKFVTTLYILIEKNPTKINQIKHWLPESPYPQFENQSTEKLIQLKTLEITWPIQQKRKCFHIKKITIFTQLEPGNKKVKEPMKNTLHGNLSQNQSQTSNCFERDVRFKLLLVEFLN